MEDIWIGDQKANEFWPVYTQDEYNEYNSLLMANQETSEPKVYFPIYKKLLENLRKFGYEKLANEIGIFFYNEQSRLGKRHRYWNSANE